MAGWVRAAHSGEAAMVQPRCESLGAQDAGGKEALPEREGLLPESVHIRAHSRGLGHNTPLQRRDRLREGAHTALRGTAIRGPHALWHQGGP